MRGPITHLIELRREGDFVGMTRRFGLRRRLYTIVDMTQGLSYWELV